MSDEQDVVEDEVREALAWFDSRYPESMVAPDRSGWQGLLATAVRTTIHDLQTARSHYAQAVADLKDVNVALERLSTSVLAGINHLQQAPR